MPLKKGKSRETVSENVSELMHDYEQTGKVGRSRPPSKKKAQKQAVAAALSEARRSGAKIPKPGKGKSTTGLTKRAGTSRKSTTASRTRSANGTARKSAPRKRATGTGRTGTATKRAASKRSKPRSTGTRSRSGSSRKK